MNLTLDPTIPKSFYKAHCFLQAGKENREHMAYLAFKGRIPWHYSIPLESVVSYLRWRKRNSPDIRLLLQSPSRDVLIESLLMQAHCRGQRSARPSARHAPWQAAGGQGEYIPTPQSVVHLHGPV
ncbi:hypothetical protein [Microcoleus phage My-WqHQDG]|nr:hypothetical protein [Microcoleus phage My-WqHQDG]